MENRWRSPNRGAARICSIWCGAQKTSASPLPEATGRPISCPGGKPRSAASRSSGRPRSCTSNRPAGWGTVRTRQLTGIARKEQNTVGRMTHAIVIGAGVVGTSIAFRLTQAGIRVTILEAGYVGGGTSGASFAWINANNKPPRAYHDLNVAGMHAHAALADEFGRAPWWHRSGNIEWYLDDAKRATQREKIGRLRSWGYDVEWLTSAQLRDLEPDIDPEAVA